MRGRRGTEAMMYILAHKSGPASYNKHKRLAL